jgi:hypothetical protein
VPSRKYTGTAVSRAVEFWDVKDADRVEPVSVLPRGVLQPLFPFGDFGDEEPAAIDRSEVDDPKVEKRLLEGWKLSPVPEETDTSSSAAFRCDRAVFDPRSELSPGPPPRGVVGS